MLGFVLNVSKKMDGFWKGDSMKKVLALSLAISLAACSTTQKTGGEGLLSVVTQNVLTIAGNSAMEQADFSLLSGRKVTIELSGFVEERNKGFVTNLVSSKAEASQALLARTGSPDIVLEVVINKAGNDAGSSGVPVLKAARRTEATVDVTLNFRNPATGKRLSQQRVAALSKYEQARWVGFIDGKGAYFVRAASAKDDGGVISRISQELANKNWERVTAP